MDDTTATAGTAGVRDGARRALGHLRALARLERELARRELREKGAAAGAGAALGAGAVLLLPFVLGFGLATAAVALSLVVPLWLALLIVFAVLLVLLAALGAGAAIAFRRAAPFVPELAVEEARLTRRLLGGRGG